MHTCRICRWTGKAKVLTVKKMRYVTREEFAYFECENYHCLQIAKVPENLGDYYGNTYYNYRKPPVKEINTECQTDDIPILDVGCGTGDFYAN